MRYTKQLSALRSNSLPTFAEDYLQWSQTSPTIFTPKGPSVLATNLIQSYFQNGSLDDAHDLFDEMPDRDVVAWTSMVAGYASRNENWRAWRVFCDMVKNEIVPNAFTFSSVLKVCKGMKDVSRGSLVHGSVVKRGMEGFIYVDNSLMDMYATCCASMRDACLVFRHIREKNAVSWTTLITGFTHRGRSHSALRVFKQMLHEVPELNPYSLSIAVRACASTGSQNYGRQIQAAAIKHGFESNLPVMNSILDMYCRFVCLPEANQCFNEMSEKDLITWNTLISGYEKWDSNLSLSVFSRMESEGFTPNCFTFTSVAAACANLAVLSCGQQVHGGIIRRGINSNLALANALIDMYAKCGSISEAHKIFSEMSSKDLVSWTSMMIGYGAHGYGKEAVALFEEMVRSDVRPDQIVFMAVLSSCSHAGLVDQGLRYFNYMMGHYKIRPNQEIYGCVVDLLGRAGRVEEAYQLIQSMPFKADESVWGALLSACKTHNLLDLGKLAALRVLDLQPDLVSAYIMLSNIYAAEGKWSEFARTRRLMKQIVSKKVSGKSWIEVRNEVYSFVVDDTVGIHMEVAYQALGLLWQHMKAKDEEDCLIHAIENET
ncbi:Putative pentatricopeptide repeat-containing protein At1g56570 [Linum perenne]